MMETYGAVELRIGASTLRRARGGPCAVLLRSTDPRPDDARLLAGRVRHHQLLHSI
jgi:hypothetical protein